MRKSAAACLLPFSGLLALAASAPAFTENTVSVSVGTAYSDNIFLRPSDSKLSKTWIVIGMDADMRTRTTRLETSLLANLTYHSYSETGLKSELEGRLDGNLRFNILPGTLVWVLDENYGQGEVRAKEIDSPANRQKINYLSTGPDVYFQMGERNRLVLQGRYALSSYEISPDDSRRTTASIALERRVSQPLTVSARVNARRIEFTSSLVNSAFDVQDATLGVRSIGVRSTLEADGGYSVLRDRGTSEKSLVAHLVYTRRTTMRSSLSFSAGQEFTDSGESFRIGLGLTAEDILTRNAVVSADPLRLKYAGAGWSWRGDRTSVRLQSEFRQERRETATALNVDRKTSRATITYRLGPRFEINAFGGLSANHFIVEDSTLDDNSFGAGLTWLLSPRFSVNSRIEHRTGDSLVNSTKFAENRVTVTFGYRRTR